MREIVCPLCKRVVPLSIGSPWRRGLIANAGRLGLYSQARMIKKTLLEHVKHKHTDYDSEIKKFWGDKEKEIRRKYLRTAEELLENHDKGNTNERDQNASIATTQNETRNNHS